MTIKNRNYPSQQAGFIISMESMIFATVLVLGLVMGWVSIRDSFNAELMDSANAIEASITFPYFSDPNRGTAPAATDDAMHFQAPQATEDYVTGGATSTTGTL